MKVKDIIKEKQDKKIKKDNNLFNAQKKEEEKLALYLKDKVLSAFKKNEFLLGLAFEEDYQIRVIDIKYTSKVSVERCKVEPKLFKLLDEELEDIHLRAVDLIPLDESHLNKNYTYHYDISLVIWQEDYLKEKGIINNKD